MEGGGNPDGKQDLLGAEIGQLRVCHREGRAFFLLARPSPFSHFWKSAGRPLQLAAAQDMEMDVKDGLSGGGAII